MRDIQAKICSAAFGNTLLFLPFDRGCCKESSVVERKNPCGSIFLMSSYIKGMDFACTLCIRVCIDINLSLGVSLLDDTWSIIH